LRVIVDTLIQQESTNPERIYFLQWRQTFVAPQCGTSFMLVFRWRAFSCSTYSSVKFSNIWFKLFGIELIVNDCIIMQLCLLTTPAFFIRKNKAHLRYALVFSTTFFLILSVKISWNRNDMKGNVYWIWRLSFIVIYFYIFITFYLWKNISTTVKIPFSLL
jgi:hypothetical protein